MTDEELERIEYECYIKDIKKLLTQVRGGIKGVMSWLNSDREDKAEQAGVFLICSLRNVLMSPALGKSWGRLAEGYKRHTFGREKDIFKLLEQKEEKA